MCYAPYLTCSDLNSVTRCIRKFGFGRWWKVRENSSDLHHSEEEIADLCIGYLAQLIRCDEAKKAEAEAKKQQKAEEAKVSEEGVDVQMLI